MRKTGISFRTIARCTASRAAIAALISNVAIPLEAASTAAATQNPISDQQAIIITAPPQFRDIQPERELDQDAIDSYGLSTIDELLGEVEVELGDEGEEPLIFVNGQRINDLSEIGGLPVEALRDLVVLPRGVAVRAGGTPNQRVISLTLKPKVRSATLTAATKVATEGDWHGNRGEAILTNIKGSTRANLTFRARDESRLLESDRHIIQPTPTLPYALSGNVVGYPNTLGEIDPALSALAGQVVTVTPFPASTTPTLADFVAQANRPAVTDVGQFRTLRPSGKNYDFNGTFATRLAPWLSGTATVNLNKGTNHYQRGLPAVLFIMSPDNAFSPFTDDVGLALYGKNPLRYRSRHTGGQANLTLDATFGQWSANLNAKYVGAKDLSRSEQAATTRITLDDSVNPFATDLTSLIGIRTDHTSARSTDALLDLTANGPAGKLPAGDIALTVEGRLDWNRLKSFSSFSLVDPSRKFRRSEQSIRAAVEIPLASRANNFIPMLGEFSLTGEYARIHFSDAGTLNHHELGANWEPMQWLRLRGSVEETDAPAPIQILGDPVIVTPDVRIFDPLTGQTVEVTQITGGNPSLLPQTTKLRTLSALFRLVPRLHLELNTQYTDTDRRNFLSSLPDSSAAIMLAFPERFIRDANGNLITVDLRPVNFDSEREKRLRWGLSMNTKLGASPPPGTPAARAAVRRGPPTYLQLNFNHTMVFSDQIVIRPGLDPVNLLKGGAIGIGGGRTRHQLDATAAITSGGVGARLGVTWRGKSSLNTRISGVTDTLDFSSLMLVNLRAFADAGRVVPSWKWAKGFRISLEVVNAFNRRQRVRDSFGDTPLQYQPAYRDPIGRTIEIELRKVF
jgi:hypothetical protein